jgi:hypothetical protein|tara:strand:+ start:335 stop:478 length:144 start_codon:yes stop_codon:yes gene_type:complete
LIGIAKGVFTHPFLTNPADGLAMRLLHISIPVSALSFNADSPYWGTQ